MHLANAEFLARLGKLLASSPSSVFVTQKRMPSAHADVEMADADADTNANANANANANVNAGAAASAKSTVTGTETAGFEGGQHAVLFRATDGKTAASQRVKLGTVVAPMELGPFTTAYLSLLRSCLSQQPQAQAGAGAGSGSGLGLKPRSRVKHAKPDARKRDQADPLAHKAKRRGTGRRRFQRQEAHKAHVRRQRALAKPGEEAKAAEASAALAEANALFAAGKTAVPGAAGGAAAAPTTTTGTLAGGNGGDAQAPEGSADVGHTADAAGSSGKKKGKKGKKGGR